MALSLLLFNASSTLASEREEAEQNQFRAVALSSLWNRISVEQARDLFEQNAFQWEVLQDYEAAVSSLNDGAKMSQLLAEYKHSFQLLDRAISTSASHDLHDQGAISLALYSLLSEENGDKSSARIFSKRASSLLPLVTTPSAKAYISFSLGTYEYYNGTLKQAIDHFEQTLSLSQQTDDIQLRSQALLYLGYSYHRAGNPFRAKAQIEIALQQCELLDYDRGIALSRRALGFAYYQLGEKQAAIDNFKSSLELFPQDIDWIERARVFNAIATIYHEFGELDLAENNFQTATDLFEQAANQPGVLNTITSLAGVELARHDLDKAANLYMRAENLAITLGDRIGFATAREGSGNLAFNRNNYHAAIKAFLDALSIYREMGINTADVQNSLGKAYQMAGSRDTAMVQYMAAANINKQRKDSIRLSENYFNIAKLDIEMGRPESALQHVGESIDLIERQYKSLSPHNLKRTFFSSVYDRFDLYIELLMSRRYRLQHPDSVAQALQARERVLARSLMDTIKWSNADLLKDAPLDLVIKEKEIRILLNIRADKLSELLGSGDISDEIKKLETNIRDLENQLEEITSDLKLRSPIYSAITTPAPFDLADFQANVLDKDSVLLEFSMGRERSYLWVVSDKEVNCYYLPSRSHLEEQVDNLLGRLQENGLREGEEVKEYQKRIALTEIQYAAAATALSDELFGQAADKIKGKRLIIAADGRLQYFPVGALPMPGSATGDPILLTNEVVYSPSAAALKLFKSQNPANRIPEKDLLVFADPVFSKTDDRLTPRSTGFVSTILGNFRSGTSLDELPRLPASADEAESIFKAVGGYRSTVRSGFSANRENVLNSDIADYKILHFASHGLIDEKRPELSGILLSLYDESGDQNDGGFIRLQDVYGLNLHSDLVVLSACDTGIGKDIRGEGVMSLTNAFLQAGSKTVVSSLWKVDDTATQVLMTEFYRGLASGDLTVAAALREAQIKMYKDPRYRSPFFWAAFTLQGDYDKKTQISAGFRTWTYPAGAVCLLLMGFYLFRVSRSMHIRDHSTTKA